MKKIVSVIVTVALAISLTAAASSAVSVNIRVCGTRYADVPAGSSLNLRKGAGMENAVIDKVTRGTPLHILYTCGDWAYTFVGSTYGWVNTNYISETKPAAVTQTPVTTPAQKPVTAPAANPANDSSRAAWLKSLIGTPAVEWGNAPGTQCVELSKWYAQQLSGKANRYVGLGNGNTIARGIANYHGWYFSTNKSDIRVGDIISFNGGTPVNTYSAMYGHTGIVYEVSGNTFRFIEQWAGSGTIRSGTATVGRSDIAGICRPSV